MRFDDDLSSNQEVATVHGEAGLNKIRDEKSRDSKYAMHGETVRLADNASSFKEMDALSMQSKQQQMMMRKNEIIAEAVTVEKSTDLFAKSHPSPKPSTRTEDATRQPIPIKKP